MSHVALTVIVPIAAGRRDGLVAAIDALGTAADSPLARIPGLHVGRLTVLDSLEDPRGPTAPALGPYLLFAADADGPQDGVIAAIAAGCGELFRSCVGCPDPADLRNFSAWLLAHRVRDGWTIMPYAESTLAEVRAGLDARERLGAFAVETHGLEPGELRRRFLEEFAGERASRRAPDGAAPAGRAPLEGDGDG